MSWALPMGTSCTSSPCLANRPLRRASSKCAWSGRPATPTFTTVVPAAEGLAAGADAAAAATGAVDAAADDGGAAAEAAGLLAAAELATTLEAGLLGAADEGAEAVPPQIGRAH